MLNKMFLLGRNVPLLAISQSLMMSSMSMIVTIGALTGKSLAEDDSLATLPLSMIFIAVMLTSIPAAMLMQKIGRKTGFMFSTLFGVGGAAIAAFAIVNKSFWLFALGCICIGIFNGFGNYFRFTAADSVDAEHKSKAISMVMIGGVVAAIVGPNLGKLTSDAIPEHLFAGSYLSLVVVYLLALFTLSFLKLPPQHDAIYKKISHQGRPITQIARQPKFIIAMMCAMLGYGVMSFVMTATPLAMEHHAHDISDTTFVIQWHVLGMFVPSFFTGTLIARFGVVKILFIGALCGFICVMTNLLGTSVPHYWVALTLLGVSWNFLFIGATTLLTETYLPEEQGKAQALNDFCVFSTVTVATLTAGTLQHKFGWQTVNIGVIPLLVIVLLGIFWLVLVNKTADAPVQETP